MKGYSRKVYARLSQNWNLSYTCWFWEWKISQWYLFSRKLILVIEGEGGVFYPAGDAMFTLLYHCVPSSREPMSQRLPHDLLVLFFFLYIKVIWVPHCRYLIWLRYTAMDTHRLASGRPRYISKNWQRVRCGSM